MSVTGDFKTQFEALVRGLTEGSVAYQRGKIEEATTEFLTDVFFNIASIITRLPQDQEEYDYGQNNPFGYSGNTRKLTDKWIRDKNSAFGIARSQRRPALWRGVSKARGKTSMVQLLRTIGGDDATTGKTLFRELGGLELSPISSGSGALKKGLVYSSFSGRAYNPVTKRYVSWKNAIDPAIDHYLKQGAYKATGGARVNQSGRVSVPGQRGSISIQRALVTGLLETGISVSYLQKLNTFIGSSSDFDEMAELLEETGIIESDQANKMGYLQRQGHAVLLPLFGELLNSDGEDGLTAYLKDKGVL